MKRILISSILALTTAGPALAQAKDDLPPDASAGDCFARVLIPDSIETVSERVIDRKASVEIRDIPARYATVQEKHLIRQGATVYKTIPAVYETVTETLEIEPGITKTYTKQVVVRPAEIIEETIAPEYETIEVQKLVSPARQERIEIPATYKTVERRIAIGGVAEWRPVLCETNTDATKIAEVQQALADAGHPLAIDGIFGPATFAAMQAYQLEQGLAVGYLTVATVERLGVSPN